MLLTVRRCYSYFVWLCGFYYGAFPCSMFSCFSPSPFSVVITSLGEKSAGLYVLLMHLFVYFARVDFCPSSLPLGVGVWLRLVIVALH